MENKESYRIATHIFDLEPSRARVCWTAVRSMKSRPKHSFREWNHECIEYELGMDHCRIWRSNWLECSVVTTEPYTRMDDLVRWEWFERGVIVVDFKTGGPYGHGTHLYVLIDAGVANPYSWNRYASNLRKSGWNFPHQRPTT